MRALLMTAKKKWGWQPWANTLAYFPFNWDANDYSWNGHHLSNVWTVSYTTQLANGHYVATRTWWITTQSAFYTTFSYTNVPITMIWRCRTSWNGTDWFLWTNKWMLWYSDGNNNWNVIKTAHNNWYYSYVASNPQSSCTADSWSYYADGNWHLIIWVFDTTWVSLYVDNMTTPVCSWTTSTVWTTCTWVLNIGWRYSQSYYSFNWDLSEFIMENKARTEQEISDYFDQTKSLYGIS